MRWIAAFPVTGGSEGNYIHIDFIVPEQDWPHTGCSECKPCDKHRHRLVNDMGWRSMPFALGKTFRGMRHASYFACRVAELLGA